MAGVVYISEEEAAKNFGALMQHIRSGDEVRLDCKDGIEAVFKRADSNGPLNARNPDETIKGHKERQGIAILDADFEADKVTLPTQIPGSTIPEILDNLSKWEAIHGELRVDEGFAKDVAEAHERFNRPLDAARWD